MFEINFEIANIIITNPMNSHNVDFSFFYLSPKDTLSFSFIIEILT